MSHKVEGLECETLNQASGIIEDQTDNYITTYDPWNSFTDYWTYKTQTYGDYTTGGYYTPKISKCWILKVTQGSYCRLVFKRFRANGRSCDDFYLKVTSLGSSEAYTFCPRDTPKPLIVLNDVNITFTRSRYISSSIEITYSTESMICAQKDHFRCSSTHCIYQYQVCDGVKDCLNGADEKHCDRSIASIMGMELSRDNVVSWMKKQRSHSSGWGKNTPRAITALYLSRPDSYVGENLENVLIVKQLELQTSIALLRNVSDPISVNELAMFVNALAVTCHNPRNFYGYDLVQILGERASTVNSPSPSAFLTLCSLNWTTSESYKQRLLRLLERPSKYPFHSDVQAVAILALTCAKNKYQVFKDRTGDELLYNITIEKFIGGQLSDGSFGNIYTTAMITQALISSGQETNAKWNKTNTAQYLMRSLNSSTIDFLSAYLSLPIFNGKSLVNIADVDCSNSTRKPGKDDDITDITDRLGGKMKVKYSLITGDQKDVVQTLTLRVPENSSAYDVMRVAQVTDPKYKFRHRDVSGQMYVYEIAGIINDPESGMFWLLHIGETRDNGTFHLSHHAESPDKFILKNNDNLIMWYKTAPIVDMDSI